MTGVYDIIDKIKTFLYDHPIVNSVTFGDFKDVDIDKTTIFPLSHFLISDSSIQERTISFTVDLLFLDVIDETSEYEENDVTNRENHSNLTDVLNTQFYIANGLITELRRGDLYDDKFQLTGNISCQPFSGRFENKLAGWSATINIEIPNNLSVC